MTALSDVGDPLTKLDPDGFAALYDRHFAEIYGYVAARLGRQVADEVAADTFLTAYRKRHSFDPARGEVRPWLYGIATRLVSDHRRSETRRLRALLRLPADGEAENGHEDRVATRVDAAGVQGRLAAALAELSDGDRDALLLVALAGLTHEETARALDIPAGTVGSRLNRARRKVRAALGGSNPLEESNG
ncbi:RNA polymerase sigma factor [Acrocarpospora catenulata]|uniref:RNA polymerase sigma factor n=1 Tax=Acrocarpospora catenulata TaxID=2836182 RepID=UPI001BDADE05|nr:RNA polymerase sigma factor [Acrocarpospora catenulata]